MIKLRIVGYERIIAAGRAFRVYTSNYFPEMDLYLKLFKISVIARILNDGVEADLSFLGNKFSKFDIGFLEYKHTINNLRQIVSYSGHGWGRTYQLIRWKPLTSYTLWEREQKGYPYPQFPRLYRKGDMLKSLIIKGYHGHIEEIWSTGFRIGADNFIAAIQHYGNKHIPARPYFYLSNDLFFYFRKIIQLKINSAFRMIRSFPV